MLLKWIYRNLFVSKYRLSSLRYRHVQNIFIYIKRMIGDTLFLWKAFIRRYDDSREVLYIITVLSFWHQILVNGRAAPRQKHIHSKIIGPMPNLSIWLRHFAQRRGSENVHLASILDSRRFWGLCSRSRVIGKLKHAPETGFDWTLGYSSCNSFR